MKTTHIANQILFLATMSFLFFFSSCNAQNSVDNLKQESIKLEVKIMDVAPIGWGFKYKARILKGTEDETTVFDDTITFEITASVKYEELKIGEVYSISFQNSKEICKTSYFPAITGTVSNENEIWVIEGKPLIK
ncbi:MAG: hypothetical protein RBS19_05350 [Bacteroidales bacterium]|nr:hypothetical protein [Bacteroidales bacterium]MDY0216362.1 hypothetical protein [Bacteroidales bacterium]